MLCQVIGVQLRDRMQMKGGAFSIILSSEAMRESQVKGMLLLFYFSLHCCYCGSDLLLPSSMGFHFSSLS
jgi:hypothetical protein